MSIYLSPSFSNGVSMESLVVPAIGDTITLFSPSKLIDERGFAHVGLADYGYFDNVLFLFILLFLEKLFTISSSRSPKFSIFAAEIGIGSPSPSS